MPLKADAGQGIGAGERRPGSVDRPGTRPPQRPSSADIGNFLGVAERPGSGARPGIAERPGRAERALRPEQRPDWSERSRDRNSEWQQRVDRRSDAWDRRADNRQQARNDFQQNRDERWNRLESAREDRQNWRDQNREDWQQHRRDLWSYRGDRAEEIWDHTRDFYDDVFDDRWWGRWGWGAGWIGHYPANPWWWWAPAAFGTAAAFVEGMYAEPVYIDYGVNVIYEEDTVYVDSQPIPVAQYSQPITELAVNVEQPPPPMPPPQRPVQDEAQPAAQPAEEWLPLGVFALAQEEKGEPVMFFQISVNREGRISGAYTGTITNDQRPIAGRLDKATQRAAWRIGENTGTIFETSLGNLTLDVSPLAVHFGNRGTQTWLLVRMPEPSPSGQSQDLPRAPQAPPPLKANATK